MGGSEKAFEGLRTESKTVKKFRDYALGGMEVDEWRHGSCLYLITRIRSDLFVNKIAKETRELATKIPSWK